VVRTLWLRPPANATPLSWLRVIVRRRRGTEQRIFYANFVSTTTSDATADILRFGIWDWTRVACHAGDERAEGEEGKGVDDEEVRDEVQRGAQSQIVVVEQDVQDGGVRCEEKQDRGCRRAGRVEITLSTEEGKKMDCYGATQLHNGT
jgi:hypothetical protein